MISFRSSWKFYLVISALFGVWTTEARRPDATTREKNFSQQDGWVHALVHATMAPAIRTPSARQFGANTCLITIFTTEAKSIVSFPSASRAPQPRKKSERMERTNLRPRSSHQWQTKKNSRTYDWGLIPLPTIGWPFSRSRHEQNLKQLFFSTL